MKTLKRLILWIKNKLLRASEIHYIGGSETLPAPLAPEDEAELMSRFYTDGENVRRTLIEHNLRLVVYIARRFDNTGITSRI